MSESAKTSQKHQFSPKIRKATVTFQAVLLPGISTGSIRHYMSEASHSKTVRYNETDPNYGIGFS